MYRNVLIFALLLAAAVPAQAEPKQNLLEYVTANLRKDNGLPAPQQERIVAAIKDRFASYAYRVVPKNDTSAADVVLRMIIEGTFDETAPERIAEVAFSAYQAMGRGAPADVVEGIALYGYRKKIPGDRIGVWANGYREMTDNRVPPEVAADLVRNAMEHDWDDSIFRTLKWSLVEAAKKRFNVRDYAVYMFGNMLSGKRRPGELSEQAQTYFQKLAKTKAAPVLPPYEGVFSRVPVDKLVYEAKPKEPEAVPAAPVAKAEPIPAP
ncbi:MAG: hypothetical protein WC881_11430, partial [Elusimicrobiota bacterium]